MKPVRIKKNILRKVGSFGMTLEGDHPDCQVGTPFLAMNGRFVITERKLLDDGRLEIALKRDFLTRRQRRHVKTQLKKGRALGHQQ